MAEHKYLRHDGHSVVSHLIEKCGEVLTAAGKTLRWGPQSVNPELAPDDQETNREWLLRELNGLEILVARTRKALGEDQADG